VHNGLQLNFSLGFGTVFYRIANNKAKCLSAICKAKINELSIAFANTEAQCPHFL
jgi:hypothetical protein